MKIFMEEQLWLTFFHFGSDQKKGGGSIKKTTWDFDVLLVIRLGLNINYFCLDQVGVGRSTRELRPDTNNAVFDSRVLSKHQVVTFQVSAALEGSMPTFI